MTNWITRDSTDPPALAPAAILDLGAMLARVDHTAWKKGMQYRQYRDPEGIPYCSAEGLEPWAEYVATDSNSDVIQTASRINKDQFGFLSRQPYRGIGCDFAPSTHRHPGDWKDSLMRVWRD